MNEIQKLLEYQTKIADIQYTVNLLSWELKLSTPQKAEQDLINLITSYKSQLFELQTSSYYGELLESVISQDAFHELEEPEKQYIMHLLEHYRKNKKIPSSFYAQYVSLKSKSNMVWRRAKEEDNYDLFKPYLREIIEMTKQYYRYLDPTATNLYDVMLNEYEIGVTSEMIDSLFDSLKKRILPLIPAFGEVETSPKIQYTDAELIECARYLLEYIGFDNDKGNLGICPHVFTEKMCAHDIRIAFANIENPIIFVKNITHEGGHGIFEQNIKENLSRYENATIDNAYALHESQSRFYENILGGNKNFWVPIYEEIKKMLRLELSLDEFMKLLNTPKVGLIRTRADELTYCMHIIVRYEIERDIFNGSITVDEIPQLWNQKMKEYLGVEVDTMANGLMQDVHWSEGDFGYFPSYLLGTIYDGMFMKAVERDLGSIDELLRTGKVKQITSYLIDKIYKNGGAYNSLEVIREMCQEEVSIEPIACYFEKKYRIK